MITYNFHDYVLLRTLNETYPGILEMHGGQVIVNELFGWGKKPVNKYNPANNAAYDQWAGQMAQSNMPAPQQSPRGPAADQWGQQMQASGQYAGFGDGSGGPSQQGGQKPLVKAQPLPTAQPMGGQAVKPAQGQPVKPAQQTNPDVQLLTKVMNQLQNPQLKQQMQQFIQSLQNAA